MIYMIKNKYFYTGNINKQTFYKFIDIDLFYLQ